MEPKFFHVIRPNVGLDLESYRVAALAAYHRVVKRDLLEATKANSLKAKKRKKQPEFIERKMEKPALRKAVVVSAPVPAVPAQAPPKKPVQAVLPLIHAPAVKREGFAWDASKEIE